jgi:hypothetical protein
VIAHSASLYPHRESPTIRGKIISDNGITREKKMILDAAMFQPTIRIEPLISNARRELKQNSEFMH